jgi:nitroreductase
MTDDPRSDDQPTIDVANADLLLSTTRSVRKRLDFERPVERETLLECLELAVQAPTASNRQLWRWMIVTDPELKTKIADIYREQGMDYLRNGLAESESTGDSSQLRVKDSAVYLAENFERAPAYVIPCIEEDLAGKSGTASIGTLGSIIQAGWSFQLAARERGLGSVWTTHHLDYEREAAEVLGIPFGEVTQVALLPVAYTVGTDFKPARRNPLETVLHWETW